jgi:hypothetical protein
MEIQPRLRKSPHASTPRLYAVGHAFARRFEKHVRVGGRAPIDY